MVVKAVGVGVQIREFETLLCRLFRDFGPVSSSVQWVHVINGINY